MSPPAEESLRIALILKALASRPMSAEHARILGRELLGRGHEVRSFGPWGLPGGADATHSTNPLLPHHDGQSLREFDPEVILVYDAATPAAFTGARQARRLGVPLLLFQEGLPHGTPPLERLLRRFGHFVWGSLLRRQVTRVICLDPVARETLVAHGYEAAAIEVVTPGVDLEQYRPGLTSHLPALHGIRGRTLLYVGSLELGQGLETLIRAFAETVGRRRDWSLVLAGEGTARHALRAHATRFGIGTQVHFLPEPREEELPGLLGSSTLCASPRRDEGAGSLIERRALACGLPLLASDRPGLRHLVENDGCGRLAAGGALQEWIEAIQLAAGSPERRRRWSLRARHVAEERFAWPRIVERIAVTLLEMTGEWRATRASANRGETLAEVRAEVERP